MKELSLHILDIAQNSIKAGATLITLSLIENDELLLITVDDNGCGMDKPMLERVTDPYTTTRLTRKVGMGLPLYRLAAEQAGGWLRIRSKPGVGTTVEAAFVTGHIDCPPLGDIVSTMTTLIQGAPFLDFCYLHRRRDGLEASLDTRVLRETLGEVSLAEAAVLDWIRGSLQDEEDLLLVPF